MADIRPLTSGDAAAIAKLEETFHDTQLRDGEARLKQLLEACEYEKISHSFGLFEGGELVGYLLSYGVQDSVLPPDQLATRTCKDAVYVEDVAILEPYRRHFISLFNTFVLSAKKHHPTIAVEAIGIEPMIRHWQRQEKWAQKLGYTTDIVLPVGEVIQGYDRYLIRWESTEPAPSIEEQQRHALAEMDTVSCTLKGRSLQVKCLRRQEQIILFQDQWDTLLAQTPGHTAFQTAAYQRLWWQHFSGESARLCILMVCEEDRIIGVAPLYTAEMIKHGQQLKTIGFIGSRWEADRPVFLFADQFELCLDACLHYLITHKSLWQRAYFYEQVGDERLPLIKDRFQRAGYLVGELADSLCPTIQFAGTWTDFIGGKSRKFRKNIEAAQKKLRGMGEIHYTVGTTAEATTSALMTHKDLESRSWKAQAGVGISRNEDYFAFYLDMAAEMAPLGRFVTRTLSVGDQAVASTFGLLFNQAFFSLQIVHDDAFNKASPGTYLESLEIQECFDQGLREYDFLGGFLNNKSRWTDTNRETRQVFVYEKIPYHLVIYLWSFHLKPAIKRQVAVWRPKAEAWLGKLRGQTNTTPPRSTEDEANG
ncbi:MAG: GNAT family N-acetyltransferase [Hahellaceae bacterium]|nr:GNAT family N-acetyltransferase [Hahellaceae bacterium]